MAKKNKVEWYHIQRTKAFHDYEILEKFEAGIVLLRQVKSIKSGQVNLKDLLWIL